MPDPRDTGNSPLQKILRDALKAKDVPIRYTLRGGLTIVGYPPERNRRRIIAARRNVDPSDKELEILRRDLLIVTQEQALTSVSAFSRIPPAPPWHAAECYVNRPSRQDGEPS